jgi:predicted lipoprotein with Yx(FWY)xxD motif
MKRKRAVTSSLAALVLGAALLIVAVSSGSAHKSRQTPPAADSALATRHSSLGNVLVDADGHTLYLFEGDRRNLSALSSAGLKVWPALTALRKPRALGAVSAAQIATIKTHGRLQVTYFGHPLYYFIGDKKSGETSGQGLREFGALWYVVAPSGNAVTATPAVTAPAESPNYRY